MSVDAATVRRIAHLARISMRDGDVEDLQGELNTILQWVEQLDAVDVAGVEPMTSVMPMKLRMGEDTVMDGNIPERIVANAPQSDDGFFIVPKVVE